MLLHELVTTSGRVAATSGRLAKIELLAALLQRAAADEIETAIAALSGSLRQGRIGVGYAALRAARPERAADDPSLTLAAVDAALEQVARTRGLGPAAVKDRLLRGLFARDPGGAGGGRRGAATLVARRHPGRRSDRPAGRRHAVPVSGDHAALWTKARRRAAARRAAAHGVLLRRPLRRRRGPVGRALYQAIRSARAARPPPGPGATNRDSRRARGRTVFRAGDRGRSRRADGESAGGALRRRRARGGASPAWGATGPTGGPTRPIRSRRCGVPATRVSSRGDARADYGRYSFGNRASSCFSLGRSLYTMYGLVRWWAR